MTVQPKKLAACIQKEVDKQRGGKKPSGVAGQDHSDRLHVDQDCDTDRITAPTPDAYAQAYTRRLGLALLACDGLDEDTLAILSRKDAKGRTNLQLLMRKVTWT